MFGFFFKYIYSTLFGVTCEKRSDNTIIKVVPNNLWSDHFCKRFSESTPELTSKIKDALPSLENLSYVLDVNANVGEIGLYMALLLQNMHSEKCIDVLIVEPDESKAEFIRKMIELNNIVNCVVINCAVSNKSTDGRLEFDIDSPGKSLVVEDEGNQVVIDTIDFICKDLNVSLMHIDVNKSEYKALSGASTTLEKTKYVFVNMSEENEIERQNERKFLKMKRYELVENENLKNENGYEMYERVV